MSRLIYLCSPPVAIAPFSIRISIQALYNLNPHRWNIFTQYTYSNFFMWCENTQPLLGFFPYLNKKACHTFTRHETCYMKKLKPHLRPFTKREQEIILCVETGLCSKQIAQRLFISKNTVDTHRRNILKKKTGSFFS